jgi:DNA-binding NarL/FixJ family response regulator
VKLLVVDDHPLVRKGIISTFSIEKKIDEVREASSVDEAMKMLSIYKPDIAVLDLYLYHEDGLEVVKRAKSLSGCSTKFIILTSSSKMEDFKRAQEAGVDGYLLKDAFTEDIIYAFHLVTRGKKYYDPEIVQSNISRHENKYLEELTPREKEVLMELKEGLSNNEIAKKLLNIRLC